MFKHKKYIIGLLIGACFLFSTSVYCQKISTDSLLIKALANDQLLPTLISAAQKFSPEIKRLGAGIEFSQANQRISKNAILSRLSLLSSYHYGTNYSAVNEQNVANSFTTIQSGFYNVGVGLQLPITEIINRKHLMKSTQAQIDMAAFEKEDAGLYVKQRVIEYYQELKLSHRLMMVSGSNKQAAQINYKMAEKEFMQGQMTVEQISRLLDIFNKSKIEYETYLNRFQTSLMQLDAYTGLSFSSLLNQVK
jgi:outer membrane protein TolC